MRDFPKRLVYYFIISYMNGLCACWEPVTGLLNTVALAGAPVTLVCASDPVATTVWSRLFEDRGFIHICVTCEKCIDLLPLVFIPTPHGCNLMIPSATVSQSGMYVGGAIGFYYVAAQLIILASSPFCTRNISDNTIRIGQSVSMTCTISDLDATGHTINPIMTWNASITGQSPINPINTLSTTSFSSTLIVQATLATLPYLSEYTCTTGFVRSLPIPTNKPGYLYADNIATLTPSDSFHQLIVKSAPSSDSITISGSHLSSNGKASLDSTLTCSATSYEGATLTYTWTDSKRKQTKGPTVKLLVPGSDLKYTCTVKNELGKAKKFILVSTEGVGERGKKGNNSTNANASHRVMDSLFGCWWMFSLILLAIFLLDY